MNNLEDCIVDIRPLMTNIIYFTSRSSPHCIKSLKTPALQMGASLIARIGLVQNLGGIFYQSINMYDMSHQYAELPTTILRTSTV